MKRNKFFMLGIVTVLVAVLSLTFVSNTFAKYTSTVTGQDTARVAKWAWTLGGDASGDHNSATFDVFDSAVYELDNTGKVTATVDTEVKAGSSETIIAPGTGGFAEFTIKNNSEVTGTYAFNFSANEAGVPLEWSLDNETWQSDISALNALADASGNLAVGAEAKTVKLYWRWVFSTGAADDTNIDTPLGNAGTATPSATIKLVFTQVD